MGEERESGRYRSMGRSGKVHGRSRGRDTDGLGVGYYGHQACVAGENIDAGGIVGAALASGTLVNADCG